MKRITSWIWRQGIVSTFMTGFFVLLPIMITLAIMGWAASWVVQLLGPNSLFGNILEYLFRGFLAVGAVGADYTRGAAFDPAYDVKALAGPAIIRDGDAPVIIEGQAFHAARAIAHGRKHQIGLDLKEFTGADRAAIDNLGPFHPDTFDLVSTQNLTGRSKELKMHPLGQVFRRTEGKLPQGV